MNSGHVPQSPFSCSKLETQWIEYNVKFHHYKQTVKHTDYNFAFLSKFLSLKDVSEKNIPIIKQKITQ